MTCVKQFEKLLQQEKQNAINIAYHQGHILHKFKISKYFIDTLIKNLKMSKSTVKFKTNLYKLLQKFPLLRLSTRSMHYFKTIFWEIELFCGTSRIQFKVLRYLQFLKHIKYVQIVLNHF